MKPVWRTIFAASLLFGGTLARGQSLPRFEDYPASKKFTGRPARVVVSHPRARLFRTMLREQAARGPNFAGSYTLAYWGCGAGCRGFAVVDARTGRVYFNPKALNVGIVPGQEDESLQFRPDSRLLVVAGTVDGFGGYQQEAKFFYEWRGNRFRQIRKTAIKMYAAGRS